LDKKKKEKKTQKEEKPAGQTKQNRPFPTRRLAQGLDPPLLSAGNCFEPP